MSDSLQPHGLYSRPEYWSRWPFPSPGDLLDRPRNQTRVSCIAGEFFTNRAIREAQSILKEISPEYSLEELTHWKKVNSPHAKS